MVDKKVWFMTSSAGRGIDVDEARDEPSHIHVPRPSRLPRRDTSVSSVEPTDEVRDPAAAQVTMQAA